MVIHVDVTVNMHDVNTCEYDQGNTTNCLLLILNDHIVKATMSLPIKCEGLKTHDKHVPGSWVVMRERLCQTT